MAKARVQEIIRQFPENGLKLLLHDPHNVRDLLRLAGSALVDEIAFERMAVDPTTYVGRDYRHVESDLVLTAPLGARKGTRPARAVTLYILIEHQSEPDRLMVLRLLDYLVQIWKAQVRDWGQGHRSLAGVRLRPVLPVVFYTGTRAWGALDSLPDLIERGEEFRAVTPALTPLFVNLPALPAARLESAGGYFGQVLELVQQRRAERAAFAVLLRRVVANLEKMQRAERLRWLELLSYICALVYHERAEPERDGLRQEIEASVRTDKDRREVTTMVRTIAEALRDEGRQEGAVKALREALLRQLRGRFGKVPRATEKVVQSTDDLDRLNAWLDAFAKAQTLEDVGIRADK